MTNCILSESACLPLAAYDVKFGKLTEGDRYTPYSAEKRAVEELGRKTGKRNVPFSVLTEFAYMPKTAKPADIRYISPFDVNQAIPDLQIFSVDVEVTAEPVTPQRASWPVWLSSLTRDGSFTGNEP